MACQASQCQQGFSKPCLVNLISKETHLVFSINHSFTSRVGNRVDPYKLAFVCLFVCLFDSLRPLKNLSVMREGSSWVEPVLSKDKCVLLKDHNAVTPVRLEPAALRSRVKHSTTEPLRSLISWLLIWIFTIFKTQYTCWAGNIYVQLSIVFQHKIANIPYTSV